MSTGTEATALPAEFVKIAVDPSTEPFWQAARERRLVAPRCADCGTFRLPPTPFCPHCQSTVVDWTELSGRATVYTYTVVSGFPGLPDITLVRPSSTSPTRPAPGWSAMWLASTRQRSASAPS